MRLYNNFIWNLSQKLNYAVMFGMNKKEDCQIYPVPLAACKHSSPLYFDLKGRSDVQRVTSDVRNPKIKG